MKDWYSSIYKACIFASLVAFIIGFFAQSQTSLAAYIAGYSVLTLGIMMILLILFNNVLRVSSNGSAFQIIYSILMTSGPFLLILGVISFVLYLLLQIYLVYTNINTESFETNCKISKVTSSFVYLLGVLTAICSIILSTILKYYSTDGFTNIS